MVEMQMKATPEELADEHAPAGRSRSRKRLIISLFFCVVVFGCLGLVAVKVFGEKSKLGPSLPASVVQQAAFPIFYYPHDLPGNLRLVTESVQYDNGYLFFQLTDPDNTQTTVTVTEQRLPSSLSTSIIQGKEKVEGTENNATISFDGSRMIGYMISKDKKTLVVMNAANGIELDTFKDLLRLLKPI